MEIKYGFWNKIKSSEIGLKPKKLRGKIDIIEKAQVLY